MRAAPDDLQRSLRASYGRLFRTLSLYAGDPAEGKAITDRAWMRAAALWPRVRRLHDPDLWVLKRSIRLASSPVRRIRARPEPAPPSGASAIQRQSAKARTLIAGMPARRKLILLLRHVWDLDPAQIVDFAGTDERAVTKTLERAASDLEVSESDVPALIALAASDLRAEPDVGRIVNGGRRFLRDRLIASGAVAAVAAVAIGSGALLDDGDRTPDVDRDLLPPGVTRIELPARGRKLAGADAVVWVAVAEGTNDALVRVGPDGAESPISLPGRVASIAAADGAAWALIGPADRRRAVLVDPTRDRVVLNAGAPQARSLTLDEGDLWISQGRDLLRREAATGRGLATVPLDQPAGEVLAGAGSVWVGCACPEGGVVRVSPERNRVEARFNALQLQAVGGDRAWVSAVNRRGGQLLTWIEVVTDQVREQAIEIAGEVAAAGDDVWVLTAGRGRGTRLVRLDPVTRRSIGAPVPLPLPAPAPIAAAGGRVWVLDGASVLVVDPED